MSSSKTTQFLRPQQFMPYSTAFLDEILGAANSVEELDDIEAVKSISEDTKKVDLPMMSSASAEFSVIRIPVINPTLTTKYLVWSTKNQVFYISGFCSIAVLKGKLSVNGHDNTAGSTVDIKNPAWQPAYRAFASSANKAKQSVSTKKVFGDLFGTDGATFATDCVNLVSNADTKCCFIVEELAPSQQSWMIAAEDQSLYSTTYIDERQCIGKSSVEKAEFLKTCQLSTETIKVQKRSIVGVNSALIGSLEHIVALGIEVTNLSSSWVNGCEAIKSSLLKRDNARVVVCGAKGVGKSTCVRNVVNSLLSLNTVEGVCIIDCDLGQPELTLSGVISLHVLSKPLLSASHLQIHDSEPVLSFYIGDTTSKHEPETLISCLNKLVAHYRILANNCAVKHASQSTKLANNVSTNNFNALLAADVSIEKVSDMDLKPHRLLPLVVNTDGFVRNMGAEVLVGVMEAVEPTHVLHISSEKDKSLPAVHQLNANGACSVMTLEPGRVSSAKVAAVDLRVLRMVSYFLGNCDSLRSKVRSSSVLTSNNSGVDSIPSNGLYIRNGTVVDPAGDIALALLSVCPYLVPFDCSAIRSTNRDVSVTQLLASLNASVVGLVASSPSLATSQHILSTRSGTQCTIKCSVGSSDTAGHCIGLGIVRAIDLSRQYFVLITPVKYSSLISVDDSIDEKFQQTSSLSNYHHISSELLLVRSTAAIQLPNVMIFAPGLPVYPYLSSESTGEGSSKMKARNNVKRRAQQQQQK